MCARSADSSAWALTLPTPADATSFAFTGGVHAQLAAPNHAGSSVRERCAEDSLLRLRGGDSKGTVLITGGAGYIGTHTAVALQEAGYDVMVLDNFSNSCEKSLDRVKEITGKGIVKLFKVDILNPEELNKVFSENKIDTVIHCAGLKAVGESVREPVSYYENNFVGSVNLIKAMSAHNCKRIVFSSSATVYGNPSRVPITEEFPLQCTSPYGRTKFFIEEMLRDVATADPEWKVGRRRGVGQVGLGADG